MSTHKEQDLQHHPDFDLATEILGDIMEQAEPVMDGDTELDEFVIPAEIYERVVAFFAGGD